MEKTNSRTTLDNSKKPFDEKYKKLALETISFIKNI